MIPQKSGDCKVVLPLNMGLKLPEDESLSLLIEITEEMDHVELHVAYERRKAAGEASTKQLFRRVSKISFHIVYAVKKQNA